MIPPISVRDLTVGFGTGAPVLTSISWTAAEGECWAVVGPNGSGKSTLLKTMLGLLRPASGSVELFGQPLPRFSEWVRVGYLPQFTSFPMPRFPATVREVVAMGRLSHKTRPRMLGRSDALAVRRSLEDMGIAGLEFRRIGELSGGQLQRVLLARAIVNRPSLLLLDEPTAAIDPEIRDAFWGVLDRLRQETGATLVLVTHDHSAAGQFADRLLYLDRTVVFSGSFASFCKSADMNARFGAFTQHLMCHQHGTAQIP